MSVATSSWDDLLQGEEIAYLGTEPACEARLAPLPDELHPRVRDALAAQGIDQLYTHQHAAWDAAARGEHVVVTTGTASGKTLAFNLPVLDAIAREPKQRALYLYPTKALAQDQLRSLSTFRLPRLRAAIYDGDTESERRWQIRKWANLVLTNPDMLHVGVLPHHDRWGDVLSNLRYVIVDEAHVYRGVFGSHVANVLRRLRRLVPGVRIMLASATVANPVELAERLTGLDDVALVDSDGSPQPRRHIAMWNPPLEDEALALRRSVFGEAADILADLLREGARSICFVKSRRGVELLSKIVSDLVPEHADAIAPYRAGYTP